MVALTEDSVDSADAAVDTLGNLLNRYIAVVVPGDDMLEQLNIKVRAGEGRSEP